MDVSDVSRVVVAGYDHLGRLQPLYPGGGLLVLPFVARGGEVAGNDDEVRSHPIDVPDDGFHRSRIEGGLAAVDVADLGDPQGDAADGHRSSRLCFACLLAASP